jgi:hypothetical protein
MRRPLSVIAIIVAGVLASGCGSNGGGDLPLTLTVQPESASAYTDYTNSTYQGAVLSAVLSNGLAPTSVLWQTSDACVAVGNYIANTTTVICNFTCPKGTKTATITATAQTLTASSSVTCAWS